MRYVSSSPPQTENRDLQRSHTLVRRTAVRLDRHTHSFVQQMKCHARRASGTSSLRSCAASTRCSCWRALIGHMPMALTGHRPSQAHPYCHGFRRPMQRWLGVGLFLGRSYSACPSTPVIDFSSMGFGERRFCFSGPCLRYATALTTAARPL